MAQTWFIRRGEEEVGPLSAKQLKEMASAGLLTPSDLVRTPEMKHCREAGAIKGLFSSESSPPLATGNGNGESKVNDASPSLQDNITKGLQSGLTDLISTAKQAKDLAAAHARRTQLTQITLPKAYLALGKDVFDTGRFQESLSELYSQITETIALVAKTDETSKIQPPSTDLGTKLKSGAAHVVAQGQKAKLGMKRDSLLRELGKRAFDELGKGAGSPEIVSPITEALDEISRLDEQISQVSAGESGPIWQRIPIAVLLTIFCLPVGLVLVWLNPKLQRKSKWIWTATGIAVFLVIGAFVPKDSLQSFGSVHLSEKVKSLIDDSDSAYLLSMRTVDQPSQREGSFLVLRKGTSASLLELAENGDVTAEWSLDLTFETEGDKSSPPQFSLKGGGVQTAVDMRILTERYVYVVENNESQSRYEITTALQIRNPDTGLMSYDETTFKWAGRAKQVK